MPVLRFCGEIRRVIRRALYGSLRHGLVRLMQSGREYSQNDIETPTHLFFPRGLDNVPDRNTFNAFGSNQFFCRQHYGFLRDATARFLAVLRGLIEKRSSGCS